MRKFVNLFEMNNFGSYGDPPPLIGIFLIFLPFSKNFYFVILYTFQNICVNFKGNLIFSLGKINKIKSYYDLRITRF